MPDQGAPQADLSEVLLNAIGGAALGALIAMILALSNTPVASATLSVLVGGAVVFLALHENIMATRAVPMTKVQILRIIGFSVAALIALIIGLHLRATNALGVSETRQLYYDLVEIGITESEARVAVLKRVTQVDESQESATERMIRTSSLFSDDIDEGTCAELAPSTFNNMESLIATYTTAGGVWPKIAKHVRAELDTEASIDGMSFVKGLYSVNCDSVGR